MKPQLLKVKTPNKMLFIKGRLVRSPLTTIIKHESELILLKNSLILQSAEYTIEDYIEEKSIRTKIKEKPQEKEKKIEKVKLEPTSILEKIATDTE